MPSTLLWQRLVADVEANAPWQKLRRSLLLLLQLLLVADPRAARRAAVPRAARRASRGDVVLVIDTSASMAATDVDAEPARRPPRPRRSTRSRTCRPAARSASSPRAGRPGSSSTARPTSGASGRRSTAIAPTSDAATWATRCELASAARGPLGRRRDPRRHGRARSRRRRRRTVEAPVRSCRSAATRQQPGDRRAGRPDRAVGRHALASSSASRTSTSSGPTRRLEVWGDGGLLEVARPAASTRSARTDVVIDDVADRDVRRRSRSGSSGADATATGAPDQLARRRPGLGDRPARAGCAQILARRRAATRTSRPRSRYLPEHRAVRRHGRRVRRRRPAPTAVLGPRHLRGRTCPATLPRHADPRHRAAADQSTLGAVDRDADEPGRSASLDPAEPILRYVDLSTTHIGDGAEARPAGLGPDGHPRAGGRAAALRRARAPACRRPSWPSSRATPTCRSRSRSRSCSRT